LPSQFHVKIVIVGAGIIGTSIAWHLSRAMETDILILDRSEPGGLATNAAAGILGPFNETDREGPFLDLMRASLSLYPDFVASLIEETGLSPDFVKSGILSVASSDEEEDALKKRWQWQKPIDHSIEWLSGKSARELEPHLGEEVRSAIRYPHESHVYAPRLLRALQGSISQRKISWRRGEPVTSVRENGSRGVVVTTSRGDQIFAEKVILTPGAFMGGISLPPPVMPVTPVNGQILAVRTTMRPYRHIVFYPPKGYFVPKLDGTVVIGASEDDYGFETKVTPKGMIEFLSPLKKVSPHLLEQPFHHAWSGLRPKTPDGLPIIGPHPSSPNIMVAAGHYRNGILLSPVTGAIIASLLTGKPLPVPIEPFSPKRFQSND
jgi:glycine oxidase